MPVFAISRSIIAYPAFEIVLIIIRSITFRDEYRLELAVVSNMAFSAECGFILVIRIAYPCRGLAFLSVFHNN